MPVATVKPYLLREVSFKIGADEYNCHATAVSLSAETEQQEWNTLCPDGTGKIPNKTVWTLHLEGYQSWEPDTLASFLYENEGDEATFSFCPVREVPESGDPVWTGTCILVAPSIGGTVNEFATFAVDLGLQGTPVMTRTA